MIRKMTVLILSFSFCLNGIPQQSKKLSPIKDKVLDIHYLPKNNEMIRVTEKASNSKNYQQSIVFPNGETISLEKNESIIEFSKNSFITRKNTSIDSTRFSHYDIKDHKAILRGFFWGYYENSAYILDNGSVLVSDETENYGYRYVLLDVKMNTISRIQPFKEGFFTSIFKEKNGAIFFIFQKNYKENLILLSVSAETGKEISRFEIQDANFHPQLLEITDGSMILWGEGKLISTSFTGSTLWTKNVELPNLEMVSFNKHKNILLVTYEGLSCIEAKTGIVKWIYNLNKFYTSPIINKNSELPNISLRVIAMLPIYNTSNIALVLGLTTIGGMFTEYPKLNNEVLIIDFDGSIVKKNMSVPKAYLLKLVENDPSLYLLTNDNIVSYEKR